MYSSKTLVNSWVDERVCPTESLLGAKTSRKVETDFLTLDGGGQLLTRIARIRPRSTTGLIAKGEPLTAVSVYKNDFAVPKRPSQTTKVPQFMNDSTIIELLYESRRPV